MHRAERVVVALGGQGDTRKFATLRDRSVRKQLIQATFTFPFTEFEFHNTHHGAGIITLAIFVIILAQIIQNFDVLVG